MFFFFLCFFLFLSVRFFFVFGIFRFLILLGFWICFCCCVFCFFLFSMLSCARVFCLAGLLFVFFFCFFMPVT